MFLSALAAAAAIATPSADIRVAREINRRLPAWVDRKQKWTAAELEVFADPDGKVLTCQVRRFERHEDVAEAMCKVLIDRRVVAAKDGEGVKSYGLGLMIITVDADGRSNLASRLGGMQHDRIVVTLGRLPDSYERMPETRLPMALEIDEQGQVTRCEAPVDLPEAFREVGCQQASANGFDVMTGTEGSAVPYVRYVHVVFELAAAKVN